ncbi:glycosyltransferase family 39 protein [Aquihabitans sp. G128]|uniref:glycosyltransferase family 39 protein n=1 Tax=Aquihabitans sp. G128 TaxID=2849779 RepID=UPI001C21B744|nr:glycosyltransferase family 39 protein [Aquihabitans sp. G128]QXC59999.1 glycosyltransferase family 39 protein [Aquihabitans sp. G128]
MGVTAVVAVLLRGAWSAWVARRPKLFVDPDRYYGYAQGIAHGKGMVERLAYDRATAYYPPGYPWFLGIVTWLGRPFTDDVSILGGLAQSVLGGVIVVVGAWIANRLAGRRAAMAAAVALALYPNLVFHAGALLGETLFITLLLLMLAVVLGGGSGEPPTLKRVALTALLLGLSALVRPISLVAVPVLGAYYLARWGRREGLRLGALLAVGVVLTIAPWTVRNALRMHAFVPISTNTGDNLCIGHGPSANGSFDLRKECESGEDPRGPVASELATDRINRATAFRLIKEAPGREPWLLWRRIWFTYYRDGDHDGLIAVQSYEQDPFIDRGIEHRLINVADVAYWAVVVTGVAGSVVLLRRKGSDGRLLVALTVATAVVPLAFFGDSRFKVPVIPLLILAAATLLRERDAAEPDPAVAGEPEPQASVAEPA